MPDAFAIRAARTTDASAIAELVARADLPAAGVADTQFVVAELAGHVIGCAGLERYGGAALLRSVAVDEAHRGVGVGEALVTALLDTAHRDHIDPVVLLTTTASAWFPRFGFAVVQRADIPAALNASAELRGACPDTAIVMLRGATPSR